MKPSDSLLDEIEGMVQGRRPVSYGETARLTPTVRKLSDPREDVEDVVKLLDAGEMPALRPSRLMQRQRRQRRNLDSTDSGVVELNGRPCCIETMIALDRRLHLLRLPHQFTCETCGTIYEIVSQMR
jgi:hypothetical protein